MKTWIRLPGNKIFNANNAIWQMFKLNGNIAIPPLTDWRKAMNRPGAVDMEHVRSLFESRPLSRIVPDQSIIYGVNPDDNTHIQAAGSTDGSYIMAYTPKGQSIDVVMSNIDGKKVVVWWYNPRDGTPEKVGRFKNNGIQTFTPPTSGENKDLLLVIDDANADYAAPVFGKGK